MSTKIYNAYRMPQSKLNDFLIESKEKVFEAATNHILSLIKPEIIEKIKNRRDTFKEDYNLFKSTINIIMNNSVRTCFSLQRDPIFDLNCSLACWLMNDYTYIRLFGERWFLKVFDNLPDYVEEYHYQNSTDYPKDIPEEKWQERRRNWDKIYDYSHKHLNTMLTYEYINITPPEGYIIEHEILDRISEKLGLKDTGFALTCGSTIRPKFDPMPNLENENQVLSI